MATKKFKKLPKDSQRAAFAQMDKDGTRNDRGNARGGGSFLPREVISGYRIGLAPKETSVRVQSPGGKVAITPRSGRSNQKIIADLKKANKSFV